MGPVLGPTPATTAPGTHGSRNSAARSRGQATGGETAPGTRRPSQQWQARPLREGPPPPPRHAALTGHAGQADSVGPPHPHTSAHSTWVADLNGPPSGPAVGGGGAPGLRRPSQRWKAPPRERPSATPIASNAGPQGRTLWGRCWVPTPAPTAPGTHGLWNPWLPAPEDGRLGEGQCLTPDAPHNGGRPPPQGTASHHPRGTQPPQGMQARGTVLGPHTTHPRPQHVGGGPQQPAQWAGSQGRGSA